MTVLVVFDPVLFSHPCSREALEAVLKVASQTHAKVPDIAGYWNRLQNDLIRPLTRRVDRQHQRALDRLRNLPRKSIGQPPPGRLSARRVTELVNGAGDGWSDLMTKVLAASIVYGDKTGAKTLFLTTLIEGRNLKTRTHQTSSGLSKLREKSLWDVEVILSDGSGHRIPVVCSRRNAETPWTTRYDERLPATEDGASFPFCPRDDWREAPSDKIQRTHRSQLCWRDAKGQSWSEPTAQSATGDAYHWDVFLSSVHAESYGLEHLNITRWPARRGEGEVGSLHHIPRDKKPKLRQGSGWKC